MRLAVITKVKDVLIEVPTDVFRKNLVEYSKKMSVGKAFDLLCEEIKKKTNKI